MPGTISAIRYRFHDHQPEMLVIDSSKLNPDHPFENWLRQIIESRAIYAAINGEVFKDDWGDIKTAKVALPATIDCVQEICVDLEGIESGNSARQELKQRFLCHLHDTILLLGGGDWLAKMIERFDNLTDIDADELQLLNLKLLTNIKDRLAKVHKVTIKRVPDGYPES